LMKDRSAWELAHIPVESVPVEPAIPEPVHAYSINSAALLGA